MISNTIRTFGVVSKTESLLSQQQETLLYILYRIKKQTLPENQQFAIVSKN
jgi:hypothetical protein